jgi:hypothetical protein
MDLGTNVSGFYAYNNGGQNMNTWFEKGYVRDTLTDEGYGLPPSGSTFTSQAVATHHYQMGNYSANNAILVDAAHTNVNITPAVLTNVYGGFAFLTAGGNIGGNNVMTNLCILQHLDGVNETNLFYGYDWYNNLVTPAFVANGRLNMLDRAVNTVGGGNPKLFESYFTLNDAGSPVTNIEVLFQTAPGANATTFIMAVSGSSGGVPPIISSGPLPAEQAAYATTPVSFSVLVSGTAPLTNTWLIESNGFYVPLKDGLDFNGSTISGSATTTLTVSDLAALDATNFEYIAANAFGSATSSPAVLNLRGVAGVVAIPGWNNIANETFGVGNSTNIYSSDGSVSATLTLSDLGVTNGFNSGIAGDGGNYSLMHGYMDVGAGANSDGVIQISGLTDAAYDVYIYAFPDTTRPQQTNGLPNYTVNGSTYYAPVLGGTGSTTFDSTSTAVGGTGFHGFIPATTYNANDFTADIPTNAFGNYIKIAAVAAAGGTITVDAGGSLQPSFRSPVNGIELVSTSTSQKFGVHFLGNTTDEIITPGQPPIIDSQFPTNATYSDFPNRAIVFSVTIDPISAPPLYYQWYYGSTPISGATNSTYTTLDTNGATYSVVVTNFAGAVTSSPVQIAILPPPTLSAYQTAVFAYHPLAYWPLDETNGSTARDWASTNDGTYKGNYTLGNPGVPPTAGMGADVAAGFDGSTAYVDIPVNNLNITGPITVIAWCQTPASGSPDFGTVVGHSDQSYRISVVNGGSFPRFADDGPDVVGTITAGDGTWHQIIGVYDGTEQHVYLDGKPTGNPLASSPAGSGDDVEIGQAPDYAGQRNFNGDIAQVAIIGQALSAAQVATLYNTIGVPPTVTVTPAAPSVYVGANQTFAAQTGGSTPVYLQWYYINPATPATTNYLANQTNTTYTLTNALLSDNGFMYGVVATNASGSATADVTLTVQTAAAYQVTDLLPASAEAYAGAPVTYSVIAGGTQPIFYQWLVDGAPVAGATNASFTSVAQCGQHTYQVTYTNAESAGAAITSSQVTLQGDAYPTNVTFNTNGTGWQVNGTAATAGIVNNVLTLTDNNSGEASSAFYSIPQYVGSFTASFIYTGNGGADGSTFVIQNVPAGDTALGGGGGDLGYAPNITNSIAFEINLYSGNGEIPGVMAGTNGITFANGGPEYITPGLIGLGSADPIQVNLNFANGVLSVFMQDTASLYTYSTNYGIGSPVPIMNANLGYVGFSGADGGATSTQTITDFQFHSVVPALPLKISSVTNGAVTVSWSDADPNYQLQKTASLTSPSWTAAGTPTVVNGTAEVSVSVTGATTQFYRLMRTSPCP